MICTIFCLYDFVTSELNPVDQVRVLLTASGSDLGTFGDLREQRNDGDARVTADDLDVGLCRVGTGETGDKGGSSNDVQSGDTVESVLVSPNYTNDEELKRATHRAGSKTPSFL